MILRMHVFPFQLEIFHFDQEEEEEGILSEIY